MSCCAVYGLLQEWPGKNRYWGLAYTIFFYVSNSFSLFVFVVGLDFKLIREEKHWLLLCFPLLEHLLFSLCQVLVISARDHPVSFSSVLNPFLQISGQYQELSCSISRICSVALAPGLLVIFRPLLPSSASCTLHSSMLVSSFSALILKFTIVGQIMLLKKTTGCKWRGKQEAAMDKEENRREGKEKRKRN